MRASHSRSSILVFALSALVLLSAIPASAAPSTKAAASATPHAHASSRRPYQIPTLCGPDSHRTPTKPGLPEVYTDAKTNTVCFVINGKDILTIGADGIHVDGNIKYTGTAAPDKPSPAAPSATTNRQPR
jgi:hypothetical protein